MTAYVCTHFNGSDCIEWQDLNTVQADTLSALFSLPVEDGMKIGGMFFGLCVFAWIGRLILKQFTRL